MEDLIKKWCKNIIMLSLVFLAFIKIKVGIVGVLDYIIVILGFLFAFIFLSKIINVLSKPKGFSKTSCIACGKQVGFEGKKYLDGVVCQECYSTARKKLPRKYDTSLEVKTIVEKDFSLMSVDEKADFIKTFNEQSKEHYFEEIRRQTKENNVKVKPINDVVRCPKCCSSAITADKKGFGIGKAVVGASLFGGIGLTAGNIGAKKVRITCLNCGHSWMAGRKK